MIHAVVKARRTALSSPTLEILLLVCGGALVALGAGSARTGQALALLPLDAGILLLGALLAAIGLRAPAEQRRVVALGGVLVLLMAVPFTRIPSAGEVIVCVTLVVVGLTALGARGARLPRGSGVVAALLVLLLVVTAISPDRYALLRFVPFALAFASVWLLFGTAGAASRVRVLRLVLAVGLVEALLAVVEPLLGDPQLWASAKVTAAGVAKALPNELIPGLLRSQGTLGHPLPLGVLLVAGIALLVRDAVALPARVRVGAGIVLGAGLLASGSRNSILIGVVLVIVFVPTWSRPRRRHLIGAAIAAVLLGAALWIASPLLARWAASGSATHRSGALAAVGGLLTGQSPLHVAFGNGWASSGRMFADGMLQSDGLQAVDDEFVLLLSQGGLLALALLVVLVVLAFRRVERALLPLLIALVVTMAVFDVLAWPSTTALAAMALASAPARTARGGHVRTQRRERQPA